jgi:hypothetical protein
MENVANTFALETLELNEVRFLSKLKKTVLKYSSQKIKQNVGDGDDNDDDNNNSSPELEIYAPGKEAL